VVASGGDLDKLRSLPRRFSDGCIGSATTIVAATTDFFLPVAPKLKKRFFCDGCRALARRFL